MQDKVFEQVEGNAWFRRNISALMNKNTDDFPSFLVDLLDNKNEITSIIELGCANGWRLAHLKSILKQDLRLVGIDCSSEAISDGKKRFSGIELHCGLISEVPLKGAFDLVIVNFVLSWVGRDLLIKSITEIDRLTKDGGYLIIGDFLPDHEQRRRYHHNLEEEIYTYKQDYGKLFEATGIYKEIARLTYNHDQKQIGLQKCNSNNRCVCILLEKSLQQFYPVVE